MSSNVRNNGEGPPAWGEGDEREARERTVRLVVRIGIVLVPLVLIFSLLTVAKGVYTDWLWFGQVGFLSVFKKILIMRIWLFFAGALLAAAILLVNLYIAYRLTRGESILPLAPELIGLGRLGIIVGLSVTVLLMSVVFGAVAQNRWETLLIFMNRVPFWVEDPLFNKDMSFHVAVMPMLHFIQGWLMGMVIATLVGVVALYLAIFALRGLKFELTPRVRGHLAVLGALLMLTIAAAHYLDIFELVFSGRGAAPGAGYTDVHARIPGLWLLVAIALVSAVGFVVSLKYGGLRLMVASFSLWAVLAILAGGIYPVAFQGLRVTPSELDREENYIQRAIDATGQAYNLDLIEEKLIPYNPTLTAETVADNSETIKNIRIWDHRPLRDTYNQIQTFRQYYNFLGVDVDRYLFPNGEYRQVMLSGRELIPESLDLGAQNWVNRKLIYTHGYGAVMSPVNEATEEGEPSFLLRDLPPTGILNVGRPEIYYGENTKDYVIVNTNTDEFDYPGPEGTSEVYKDYEGTGGVKVGSFLRRAAFAWQFLDYNILISGQIKSDSKIQYRRQIQDRVSEIAPFLRLDSDPYLVVGTEGRLWWIQDTYTVTDRYAYSQSFREEFNYIRNSVKVVIDAYNGTLNFFVIDPEEPLIRIYRGAFPELFKDFDEIDSLDPALREHIRYPIDLFVAQAEINLRYHQNEPQQFFQDGDLWLRSREVIESAEITIDVEPYYIIMKLPEEEKAEFILLLPFTAAGERKNMVAWMAARSDGGLPSDGGNYGKLVTYRFPEGQVDGPEQIEARITSDEDIGRELSLLCRLEGKLCIRGNLLAIPMGEDSLSMLYVEPLYIRAEALPLPQLKKVIVADDSNVVMADTLSESLDLLLGKTRPAGDVEGRPADTSQEEPVPTTDIPSPVLGEVQNQLESIEKEVGNLQDSLDALVEALENINETLAGGSQ